MRVLATNSGKMSSDELFRRLLTGEISQDELEKNPDLVTLAMRIYGREALEDLGVKITQLETPEVLPKKYDFEWSYCRYFWESHLKLPEIEINILEELVKNISNN